VSRPKLVIGNWKMHGSVGQVQAFAAAAAQTWPDCVSALCLPYPLLPVAQAALQGTRLHWGAQDCSAERAGARTGEVPASMLRDLGASWVVVGHSERRAGHGETDGVIADKVRRVLEAGMTPVVCIGESAADRDSEQTAVVLRRQLLPLACALGRDFARALIAYEPVWAIGTGRHATPGIIEDTHRRIAEILTFHAGMARQDVGILYGGSVSPFNAGAILASPLVAGVLVGGASLLPSDFKEICKAAARTQVQEASQTAPLNWRHVPAPALRQPGL
jgi:triosephosphate isomerase